MNITCKQVLLHFLKQYLKELSLRKTVSLHSFFEDFFLKEELITIIKSMFDDVALEDVDLENSTTKELLLVIGDDRYILDFFLNQWSKNATDQLSPIAVWNTLEQLNSRAHYLASKAIANWDAYDFSNYRALQLKAGKIKRVYGIYDSYVKEKDALRVDSLPKRFFEKYEQAEQAVEEHFVSRGFSKKELKIIPVYLTD